MKKLALSFMIMALTGSAFSATAVDAAKNIKAAAEEQDRDLQKTCGKKIEFTHDAGSFGKDLDSLSRLPLFYRKVGTSLDSLCKDELKDQVAKAFSKVKFVHNAKHADSSVPEVKKDGSTLVVTGNYKELSSRAKFYDVIKALLE